MQNTEPEHIEGTVEKVIYYNSENDFSVLQIKIGKRLVSATGCIKNPCVGQYLELWGKWTVHKEYGRQFSFERVKVHVPIEKNALIKYLSSELISGIGEHYAKKIVEHLGENAIRIILQNPEKLRNIDGIGKKRAQIIGESVKTAFEEQQTLQLLATKLLPYGFGTGTVRRIYNRYKDAALDVVERNPYLLCEEVWGIGFATADGIARASGVEFADERRIAAGLLHVLKTAQDDGHCYLPREILMQNAAQVLGVAEKTVSEVIDNIAATGKIHIDETRIYNNQLFAYEEEAAELLVEFANTPVAKKVDVDEAEVLLGDICKKLAIKYTFEQVQAVVGALTQKIYIITGGPGTGKTTIVDAVIKCARKLNLHVTLAAPTGRAAKRLSEATDHPAATIHRLLAFRPNSNIDAAMPQQLDGDFIVVDEVSMVDLELFHALLKSVKRGSRLLLVGDSDQLASVGAGAVLADLIECGKIPNTRLSKIMRQGAFSQIVAHAHDIIAGNVPVVRNNTSDDFFMQFVDDADQAQSAVVELVVERIPRKFGFDPHTDIQVISPMHKGKCGAIELNRLLRAKLNPSAANFDNVFAVGDKIMQIANNYELGVFNGEVGTVLAVDSKSREVVVRFDDAEKRYDSTAQQQLRLAYAITVHKSQGSEYPAVVLPLNTEHFIMLERNLLYTAITRAKKLLVIVGSRKAFEIAVRRVSSSKRYTNLAARIKSAYAKKIGSR